MSQDITPFTILTSYYHKVGEVVRVGGVGEVGEVSPLTSVKSANHDSLTDRLTHSHHF